MVESIIFVALGIEQTLAHTGDPLGIIVAVALFGGASAGVLDYATDHDADLIVMGTHGRTGLDHTLAGSVTERLVRSSHILVVSI